MKELKSILAGVSHLFRCSLSNLAQLPSITYACQNYTVTQVYYLDSRSSACKLKAQLTAALTPVDPQAVTCSRRLARMSGSQFARINGES
jgi:hypothetical protein